MPVTSIDPSEEKSMALMPPVSLVSLKLSMCANQFMCAKCAKRHQACQIIHQVCQTSQLCQLHVDTPVGGRVQHQALAMHATNQDRRPVPEEDQKAEGNTRRGPL